MKKVYFILICLSIIGGENMFGQNKQYIELAESAIANFKCAITAENYSFYGLSSPKGLEAVSIGEAVSHKGVKLSDLRDYTEEQDPNRIISEMGYVTVALTTDGGKGLETFVLLNSRDNEFKISGMGNDTDARNYLDFKRNSEMGKESTLVRIPALNRAYAGIVIEGVLNVVPLDAQDNKNPEPRPANIVFAELARQLPSGDDVPH